MWWFKALSVIKTTYTWIGTLQMVAKMVKWLKRFKKEAKES